MLQAPSTPLSIHNGTTFVVDNKIDPSTTVVDNKKTMMDLKVSLLNNNTKANSNSNWNNDVKTKKIIMEKQKNNSRHRLSSPLSTTTTVQSNVSSTSPPSSTPSSTTPSSTPHHQSLFNAARNHSFSSSQQSFQSTVSDQLLDHSHLKPGENASLLSYSKTINLYRENAKKSNNMEIQCDFAVFLVEAAKRLSQKSSSDDNSAGGGSFLNEQDLNQQQAYILEAEKLLKQVAMRGHSESQYYLANMYAAGLLSKSSGSSNKADFDKAFPLFVQSAKHHHPDAAYRAAKCYEDGLGTRKDRAKAVQYYRKAATLNHPGAMYRLGLAEMKGELGLSRNIRDGHKWLKRSAEAATPQYPHALHELALLHEKGLESIIFADLPYAVSLYHEAAVLGYAPSAYRLGECYEFGKLECKPDASLSIQYYSIAAEQQHPESCFALTAWYLVGVPNLLPPSDEQAYAWAMCAAQSGLPRAEYAVGYFTEMGIGTLKNENNALQWYQKAAQHGEKRAIQRLNPASFDDSTTNATSQHKKKSNNKKKNKSLPNNTTNNHASSSNKSGVSNVSQQQQQTKISANNNNTRKRMSFLSLNNNSTTSFASNSSGSNNRQSSFLRKATSFLRRPSSLQQQQK